MKPFLNHPLVAAAFLSLAWMLAGCASAPGDAAVESLTVRVENPLDVPRQDEVVSVVWTELAERLPSITADRVRVVHAETDEEVASQPVDEDGDGAMNTLLFLVDLGPGDSQAYRVEARPPSHHPESRTYAVLYEPRDDMAWENDRIAFRTYGKGLWATEDLVSSGVDVWTKRTRDLVIDRWYAEVDGSYHQDWGQGADFYKVGTSTGTGGTAVWRNGRIHRAPNFSGHRILANGPIRTIFELEYEPWDAGGVQVAEVRRISIDAGSHFFRQETTFRAEGNDVLEIAIGIVDRERTETVEQIEGPHAWLSVWGPLDPSVGGHGDLGSAIVIDRNRLMEVRHADAHYLVLAHANSGEPLPHFVGTGWTASGDFANADGWLDHVRSFVDCLENPLSVTY